MYKWAKIQFASIFRLIDMRILCRQVYAKPMDVAAYRLSEDMPEKLRETLPDVEDLKKLL